MKQLTLLTVLLVSLARPVIGQTVSATTGAINGHVLDNTGAVLPGVTVTIASPSLMGTRSALSDEEGLFRFPAIPPGDYTVTFELAGFTTVTREGIRVGLGFTATVNAEMPLASVQETVTVTGSSPVVDTSATKVTDRFDAQEISNLPGNREYWALLSASPSVAMTNIDVGGNQAMKTMSLSVYGTSDQHRPMVEGMVVTYGTQTMYYADLGSFDEVAFNTVGNNAEAPTPGIQSYFISKSGGNQYHGSAFFGYQNDSFQTHNIDTDQIRRGVTGGGGVDPRDTNRILVYRDFGADVGGYIRKDKLWWYYSYRGLFSDVRLVNLIDSTQDTFVPTHTIKVTSNATDNVRLIGYFNYADKIHRPAFNTFLLSNQTAIFTRETGWNWIYPTFTYKAEYNHVLSNAAFLELRSGAFYNRWDLGSFAPDKYRYEDRGNNQLRGGNDLFKEARNRPQVLGSLSYFKAGWAGSHNLKTGFEVLWDKVWQWEDGFYGDRLHALRNGEPLEIYLFEDTLKAKTNMRTVSGFVADTWRPYDRLTLNVGVRFDQYYSYLPEQEHLGGVFSPARTEFPRTDLLTWNNWAPRFGGNFDLTGGGKTVVKFNVGQYWWTPSTNVAATLNPNQRFWFQRYTWTDTNGNGQWEPGEQGRLLETRGGAATEILNPDLKNTYTLEGMVFVEHELAANFGVRTGFVWRGDRNLRRRTNLNQLYENFTVPVTVVDPGPDGVRGSADDGGTIAAWGLRPEYVGLPSRNQTRNFPNAGSDFYTWEITADKRMNNAWALGAGFSHTWNKKSIVPLDPNELINRPGGRDDFTTWTAKITSTVELPLDIRVTPLVRHQAGNPFGRTFIASLNYGNPQLLAEPISAQRMPNITVLDVRVEKAIRIGGRRLAAYFDIYNLTNANTEAVQGTSSGSSYLRPLSILAPRVARLGAKFEW